MVTFISFIVVLGILIFIHELGHFAVAKFSGVGVERFSLGFGPRLLGVKYGETEYRISVLPLGGYVKMTGESPGEDVTEGELKKSFTHKGVPVRAAIVGAGPVMNLMLSAVLFPLIFMIGIQIPSFLEDEAKVGYVSPESGAVDAGIKKGDVIKEVGDKVVRDWEGFLSALSLYKEGGIPIGIERDGHSLDVILEHGTDNGERNGYHGIFPDMEPVIGDVSPGYPAKEAGIQANDRILSVDGKDIAHWAELESLIHKNGGKKAFVVQRGEEVIRFDVTPKFNEDMKVYLVGITRKELYKDKRYGFLEAIEKGVKTSVDMTVQLFIVIKGLITGEYSIKTLGGPIMIAKVAGKAAKTGITELLSLVAFLSLQLGIINLFPIPVLDGGHLVFFAIESIKGSPLSERFLTIAQQIGMALLIALMVLVTYNDLFRIFD
jgi:regulator of sigma E protease